MDTKLSFIEHYTMFRGSKEEESTHGSIKALTLPLFSCTASPTIYTSTTTWSLTWQLPDGFTAKATPNAWKALVPSEMRQTALLYLAGKIDRWYVKPDQSGVVFILNVTDPKEAKALLDKLPLGQAGLMEFQFIPLGPLSPLRALLAEPSK